MGLTIKSLLLLGSVALLGCDQDAPRNPVPDPTPSSTTSADSVSSTPGAYFFGFDAVDAYSTYLGIYDVLDSTYNKPQPGKELLGDVLLWGWPKNLADTAAISRLDSIGYGYKKVPETKLAAIRELFREKPPGDAVGAACIAEYRTVLVFRKKGKVVGVAKICFSCLQNHIIGSTANTYYFGQDGEYEKLNSILFSLKS